MSEIYVIVEMNCETGQIVETTLDRREYLINEYDLDPDTTLEDAELYHTQNATE